MSATLATLLPRIVVTGYFWILMMDVCTAWSSLANTKSGKDVASPRSWSNRLLREAYPKVEEVAMHCWRRHF